MPGRRPLPTELKRLSGNPGRRKLNENEPKPDAGEPEVPKHLNRAARREWARIVAELRAMSLLTRADGDAIAMYCDVYARWAEASKKLDREGLIVFTPNGYPVQSPYIGIANKCLVQMKALLVEFGMTPASRSKIVVQKPLEADEFEDFLSEDDDE